MTESFVGPWHDSYQRGIGTWRANLKDPGSGPGPAAAGRGPRVTGLPLPQQGGAAPGAKPTRKPTPGRLQVMGL